jgi:acid phosphatase type 7
MIRLREAAAAALVFAVTMTPSSVPTSAASGRLLQRSRGFDATFQTRTNFKVTWGGATDQESGVASYKLTVRRAPHDGGFGSPETFMASVPAQDAAPVVVAAGDIACGADSGDAACKELLTSDLAVQIDPSAVLLLGDVQYEKGQYEYFLNGRGAGTGTGYDPTWGRLKPVTHPAVGNHEYLTPGAAGYFDYFNGIGAFSGPAGDRDTGYYSFDLGNWHLVALNSNCGLVGGCGSMSPQYQWLEADLARSTAPCTLAYMHHPRFAAGQYGDDPALQPFWELLYQDDAEVVLAGHDHNYQRYTPQTPAGERDDVRGVREFVVGTGGRNVTTSMRAAPNLEARNGTTFGVLKLTLHPTTYDWEFVPIPGSTFTDSGTGSCYRSGTDVTPPTPPVLGALDDPAGAATFPGEPGSTYCFRATATDVAGNISSPSPEECTSILLDNLAFRRFGGWRIRQGNAFYLKTYSQTRNYGATLRLKVVSAKRLAIVATTCPQCGAISVFLEGELLRSINLRAHDTYKRRLIPVGSFKQVRTGELRVKVMSSGRLVRIDALGVSAV